jgi:hypothetical protein
LPDDGSSLDRGCERTPRGFVMKDDNPVTRFLEAAAVSVDEAAIVLSYPATACG